MDVESRGDRAPRAGGLHSRDDRLAPVGWCVLVLLLLWLGWRFWKRWQANAYRREALRELGEIETAPERLPELLKRVALVAYPRAEVAELSGDAWLGFLDGTLGSTDFTSGCREVVA